MIAKYIQSSPDHYKNMFSLLLGQAFSVPISPSLVVGGAFILGFAFSLLLGKYLIAIFLNFLLLFDIYCLFNRTSYH